MPKEWKLSEEAEEFVLAVKKSQNPLELLKLKAEMDEDIFNLLDGSRIVNEVKTRILSSGSF